MPEVRLIDANALKNAIDSSYVVFGQCVYAKGIVDRQPTIEAEPVRHGHWVTNYEESPTVYCSECGAAADKAPAKWYKVCPYCGAKIDGGVTD